MSNAILPVIEGWGVVNGRRGVVEHGCLCVCPYLPEARYDGRGDSIASLLSKLCYIDKE